MLASGISEAMLSAPPQPWRQFRAVSGVSPSAVNWPLLCACLPPRGPGGLPWLLASLQSPPARILGYRRAGHTPSSPFKAVLERLL